MKRKDKPTSLRSREQSSQLSSDLNAIVCSGRALTSCSAHQAARGRSFDDLAREVEVANG